MPRPRHLAIGCLAAAATAAALPSAAIASWGHPNSKVTGGALVAWTADSGKLDGPGATVWHRDGAVRYTIVDRALGRGVPQAWIPGEFPREVSRKVAWPGWYNQDPGNGFYLRARLAVDHYRETSRTLCEGGLIAESATEVTAVSRSHALLETQEPELDLATRRGTVDLNLPFLVLRDSIRRLGEVVVGTGAVKLTTRGSSCSADESGAPILVTDAPTVQTATVADIMGPKVLSAVDDGYGPAAAQMATTIGRDGSFTLAATPRRLSYSADYPVVGGERISGTFTPQLNVAGPPSAQSSSCTVPTFAQLRRVRSLVAAQRLVRRSGFTRAYVGPSRPAYPRNDHDARFDLDFGGSVWPCGQALGSPGHGVLIPLRR